MRQPIKSDSKLIPMLKPHGIIRLVVPDLLQLAKRYITEIGGGDHKASDRTLYAVNLHLESGHFYATKPLFRLIHWWQGYPHQHKYDAFSLADRLQEAKFVDIRERSHSRSDYIPEILDMQCDGGGMAPAIYIEARKPSPYH
jgi:predicted SAM-dependent methyltransferase